MPLVFLHGLGIDGRAYVRLLSRIGGLGFTVIAVDALASTGRCSSAIRWADG